MLSSTQYVKDGLIMVEVSPGPYRRQTCVRKETRTPPDLNDGVGA